MGNGETVVAARCGDHAALALVGARFDAAEVLDVRYQGRHAAIPQPARMQGRRNEGRAERMHFFPVGKADLAEHDGGAKRRQPASGGDNIPISTF